MHLSSEDFKNWVYEMTEIRPAHLDELKNGVAFCIIAAKIRGVKVPGKINLNAKTEYESEQNFKVFQTIVFKDRNFSEFNIPNLVKGKIRNILHLLQQLREESIKRPPIKTVLLEPKRKPSQRSRTLSVRTMIDKQEQKKGMLTSLNEQQQQLEELVQKVSQVKKAVEQADNLPKLLHDLNTILYKA